MLVLNLFVCCLLVPSGLYAHVFNMFNNDAIDWGRRFSVTGDFFHLNARTRTGTTRFYFSPTGTTAETPAALGDINWFQVHGFRLNPEELETGSHLVEVLDTVSGEYRPICDDGFSDRTATALCLMSGYDRGYRTTHSVSSSFLHTNLDCFNSILKISLDEQVIVRDSCSTEKYSEDSLPCSKDQAAAVHCYHSFENQGIYHVDIVETKVKKRSFKIEIALVYEKNGKRTAITGTKALKRHRRGTKFTAEACGKEVDTKVGVAKPNKEHFVVEGNVAGKCSTGIDLFHMGNILSNF